MYGDSSNKTCNVTTRYIQSPTEPLFHNVQFHHLNLMVSGACNAFAIVLISGLMWYHATHLSNPKQQLDIMRISTLIPCYAVLTFAAVYNANAWPFVKPWIEVCQGYALANFWILICRFLAPHDYKHERDLFFAPLVELSKKPRRSPLTLRRYRRHWIYIMQGPLVMMVAAVCTNITEVLAHYCMLKLERVVRMTLSCVTVASMAMAMWTAIRHCGTMRSRLWADRAMFKMLSFKLILGLYIILEVIYMFLDFVRPSPLAPTAFLSAADIEVGVPMMATSCELALFAIFFCWAYSVTPYKLPNPRPGTTAAAAAAAASAKSGSSSSPNSAGYINLGDGDGDEEAARTTTSSSSSGGGGGGGGVGRGSGGGGGVSADNGDTEQPRRYHGGRFGLMAWLKMLNHMDMLKGFIFPLVCMEEAAEGGYTGQPPRVKQKGDKSWWQFWKKQAQHKTDNEKYNGEEAEEEVGRASGEDVPMESLPARL